MYLVFAIDTRTRTGLTGLVKDFTGLFVARLALGLCEGGLFPGLILYLSMFCERHPRPLSTYEAHLASYAAQTADGSCRLGSVLSSHQRVSRARSLGYWQLESSTWTAKEDRKAGGKSSRYRLHDEGVNLTRS